MPQRSPRPCRAPLCPSKTTARHGYCDEHADRAIGWTKRQQGRSSSARGYGGHWKKLRKVVIQRDGGLCQPCRREGRVTTFTEVDHIVPKAEGGTDSHDNLQCICDPCHREKTLQESLRARQRDA